LRALRLPGELAQDRKTARWGALTFLDRGERAARSRPTMSGVASSWWPETSRVGDVPVLQRPDRVELAGAVHRVVDGRVGGHLVEAPLDAVGPGDAAEVAVVEDTDGGLVFRLGGRPGLFVSGQGRLDVLSRSRPPTRHQRIERAAGQQRGNMTHRDPPRSNGSVEAQKRRYPRFPETGRDPPRSRGTT
jgi:hypothetical protein